MSRFLWTLDAVKIEAAKYTLRGDFTRNCGGAYCWAKRRGLLDEVCAHMTHGGRKWTEASIREFASQCKSYSEFTCSAAYPVAMELGIHEDLAVKPQRARWTPETVMAEASSYSTLEAFRRGSTGAYDAATKRKFDLLPEIKRLYFRPANRYSSLSFETWSRGRDSAIFYLLECEDFGEHFFKFGITVRDPSQRYDNLKAMPYEWEEILTVETTPQQIWDFEAGFSDRFWDYWYQPEFIFPGSKTECISGLTESEILSYLA